MAGRLAGRLYHRPILRGGKGSHWLLHKQGLESTYGAAASIVVVLIWVYYTSQIILMGAEVTHAYTKHEGSIRQRRSRDGRENVRSLSQPGGPSGRRANRAF